MDAGFGSFNNDALLAIMFDYVRRCIDKVQYKMTLHPPALTTILQIWSPTSCPAPFHAGSVSAASSDTAHHTASMH